MGLVCCLAIFGGGAMIVWLVDCMPDKKCASEETGRSVTCSIDDASSRRLSLQHPP